MPRMKLHNPMLAIAPAKINLDLYVLGKRPDGYHELDSVVLFTCAGDGLSLTVYPTVYPLDASQHGTAPPRVRLHYMGTHASALAQACSVEDNLITRALLRVLDALDYPPISVDVVLDKQLPLASGIGGGSSDAAQAVKLLYKALGSLFNPQMIAEILLPLGADMPVCLHAPMPSRIQGIGEVVQPLNWPQPWYEQLASMRVLLWNTLEATPTKQVFQAWADQPLAKHVTRPVMTDDMAFSDYLKSAHNDLAPPAIRLCPSIQLWQQRLQHCYGTAAPHVVQMSGSGATLYAIYPNDEAAGSALEALYARYSESASCWHMLTRFQV